MDEPSDLLTATIMINVFGVFNVMYTVSTVQFSIHSLISMYTMPLPVVRLHKQHEPERKMCILKRNQLVFFSLHKRTYVKSLWIQII